MDAVPGRIEMGIDVLQALQSSAKGMGLRILKERRPRTSWRCLTRRRDTICDLDQEGSSDWWHKCSAARPRARRAAQRRVGLAADRSDRG
jgi:hypothetical protein